MSDDDKWYVSRVATGTEGRMAARMEEIGVEAFCPMLKRKRRSAGSATRERIEEPALPSYLPIRAATVEAPATRELVYREPWFYDFIRDINHKIATMKDEDLNPLRAMEKAEPVKFISGPVFYLGEEVKVPYNNLHVAKAFWSRVGQVVAVKNGRYCLGGRDFPMETWFSGLQLLRPSV